MPQFTVEVDEKGDFVGSLPTEIEGILKRVEAAAHGQGYGKGVERAVKDAEKQIQDNVRAEVAKIEASMPLEREKHARMEEEYKNLSKKLIDEAREHANTLRTREEKHAQELVDRAEALKKRNSKIVALVQQTLTGEAIKAGAREESLDELGIVLNNYIGYNDDMEPFVKDPDGREKLVHGKPVSIGGFVKEYLDSHPYHRKAPAGRGGNAPGGASYRQPGGTAPADVQAAKRRFEEGDKSNDAINAIFEAGRKKSA